MHICLATDIDINALKDIKSNAQDLSSHIVEHILCSIKLYQDGFLEVTPGFSGVISESSDDIPGAFDSSQERSSLSLFLDDNTVRTGISDGFKLTTNRIRSKKGIEYEYSIQNINDVLIPHQLAEIMKKQKLLDEKSFIQNKSSTDTSSWKQDPPSKNYDQVIGIYAEIVSGENFHGNKLFVNYQVQVPQGWDLRTGNLNDGMAERDILAVVAVNQLKDVEEESFKGRVSGLKNTSNIRDRLEGGSKSKGERRGDGQGQGQGQGGELVSGADILALDGFTDGLSARGMLYGTTHTAIARESKRLSGLSDRPNYKPPYVTFVFQQGTRLFLGLSFYSITLFAIILGQNYPFWLVPALVILFTLGTGYPGGTIQVVLRENKNKNIKSIKNKKDNTTRSCTTSTYSQTEIKNHLGGPLIFPAVAHFNHLMNLSFDVKDISQSKQGIDPFQKVPIMHFQVYSTSLMGRFVLEGYGYYHIPGKAHICYIFLSNTCNISELHSS